MQTPSVVGIASLIALLVVVSGDPPGEEARTLTVGVPVAFVPTELPVTVVCDDLSVVRVDDAGTFLRLTGQKPGATACSFTSLRTPGRRLVYQFVVVPP